MGRRVLRFAFEFSGALLLKNKITTAFCVGILDR